MTPKQTLPVFIGSSTGQRDVAERFAAALSSSFAPIRWWQAFPLGDTTLGTLIDLANRVGIALIIVGPDDLRLKDGMPDSLGYVVRDNVVFELGLFAGALGARRSIMVFDECAVTQLPSNLSGVKQVRWRSDTPDSFQHAIADITLHIDSVFDQLGLGWWAFRLENDVVDGRTFFGVFEVVSIGSSILVRFGQSYYANTFHAPLRGTLRSHWEPSPATYYHDSHGPSRLIVVADVVSSAPKTDPDSIVKTTMRLKTVMQMSQIANDQYYRGRYFDIDGLGYHGRIAAKRLADCTGTAALQCAADEFSGLAIPQLTIELP